MTLLPQHASAQRHNADSKWGATFYYWDPYTLPDYSAPPNQSPWGPSSQAWWNDVVHRAAYAGFGWLAANSWGDTSNADPASLGGLVTAITNSGTNMKVALFDDTTSEVLRKNYAKHGCWALPASESDCGPDSTLRFDLSDSSGSGEGGWFYFYDHQWKRFFQTVPDSKRFKIDGRPVVFMWLSGPWYSNPSSFDSMLGALKDATNSDFGFKPYVIIESTSTWAQPGMSMSNVDALYRWFELSDSQAHTYTSSSTTSGGTMSVGVTIPGYWTDFQASSPRRGGDFYRTNLNAVVASNPELILVESIDNAEENAHLIDTPEWGARYLNITREYTLSAPPITPSAPGAGVMFSGDTLYPDFEAVCSSSGFFCLYCQGDGNLVLYQDGSSALWSTRTTGGNAGFATMQSDGNFVVYKSDGSPVWATGTDGHPGAYLVVHSDGDLVIYSVNGSMLWHR
jgi:uncharacterized protein DUF5010